MKPGMAPRGLYLAIDPSLRPAPPPPDTEEEVDWNFVFNSPSPPSPPLPSTTPPHQPPQPQPQPQPEAANMTEFKDKEEVSGGLDINFYESKKDGEQKVDVKAEAVRVGSTPVRVPSRNEAQLHLRGVKPDDSDLQESLDFTDQLLEEQYRGQANSFTRSRSSSSVAASPSIRSVSSPLPSPIANSPLLNSPRLPRLKSNSNFRTPTRKGESFAAVQRKLSLGTPTHRGLGLNIIPESPHVPQSPRILLESPSAGRRVVSSPAPLNLRAFRVRSGTQSGLSPQEGCSSSPFFPHYGYKIPGVSSPLSKKKPTRDPAYYFTPEERKFIAEAVAAKEDLCEHHEKCTDCLNKEFAYLENKIMPTSIPPEDRQKIINNNRSLRNIKNELENLLENNVLTDAVYDQIMSSLPSESSLNGPAPTPRSATQNPSPAPTDQMARMTIANPPPAYTNTPPPPPPRNQTPQPPSRPEIARATALYRYSEPDDCTFEVGDQISVFEYMNPEWWMGRNMRTGKEGVFPMNYVQIQAPQNQNGFYGNEKQNVGSYPGQPQYAQQGPPAPGPSNPYNAAVPPMAIAEGGQTDGNKPSKGGEMGKKFGKKLGNAAIFGAGATIGGNIVNSIF